MVGEFGLCDRNKEIRFHLCEMSPNFTYFNHQFIDLLRQYIMYFWSNETMIQGFTLFIQQFNQLKLYALHCP